MKQSLSTGVIVGVIVVVLLVVGAVLWSVLSKPAGPDTAPFVGKSGLEAIEEAKRQGPPPGPPLPSARGDRRR